jgi:fructokinase
MVYFGSLAQRSAHGFDQIQRLLAVCPSGCRRFCDINLRPPHYTPEVVRRCLEQADILKLNHEELVEIGRIVGIGGEPDALCRRLMDTWNIETLAVTRGAGGASLFSDGRRRDAPAPRGVKVLDSVGAGDAFAAVLAAGVLAERSPKKILSAAIGFAATVCACPGAIPPDTAVYESLLQNLGALE